MSKTLKDKQWAWCNVASHSLLPLFFFSSSQYCRSNSSFRVPFFGQKWQNMTPLLRELWPSCHCQGLKIYLPQNVKFIPKELPTLN